MDPEDLVDDYLGRLDAAAARLPGDRRAELVAEVREHIGLALAEAGAADETTVRNVLGRLGSPDEIVAAETVSAGPGGPDLRAVVAAAAPPDGRPPLSVEARALLLLTVGAAILPFIGPLLGLWSVSASARWSLTQKRTAALIVLVLLALPAIFVIPAAVAGELTAVVSSFGFLLPFVPAAGLLAAAYLVASTSVVVTVTRRS